MQDQALQPWLAQGGQDMAESLLSWPQGPCGEASQPLSAIQTLSPCGDLGQQRAAGGSCPTSARLLPRAWVLPADCAQCQQPEKGQALCVIPAALFQPGIVLSIPLEVTGGTAAAACGVAGSSGCPKTPGEVALPEEGLLMLDTRHCLSWWNIQAPWPCSWGKDGVRTDGCQQDLLPLAPFAAWTGRGGL